MKMNLLNRTFLAAGISVLATVAGAAPYTPTGDQTMSPQQFARRADMANQKEISEARLALEKSRNPDVIRFAHHMIRDHSMANAKLIAIANDEGISLPATNSYAFRGWPYTNNTAVANYKGAPPAGAEALSMSANMETRGEPPAVAHLQGLSGSAFDRAYAQDAVNDHQRVVQEFQTASQTESDPRLKQYAQSTLPTLQHHLQMAQDLANKVGATP